MSGIIRIRAVNLLVILALILAAVVWAAAEDPPGQPAKIKHRIVDAQFGSCDIDEGIFEFSVGGKKQKSSKAAGMSILMEEQIAINALPLGTKLLVHARVTKTTSQNGGRSWLTIDQVGVVYAAEHLQGAGGAGAIGPPPSNEQLKLRWYEGPLGFKSENKKEPTMQGLRLQVGPTKPIVRATRLDKKQIGAIKRGTPIRLFQIEVVDDEGKPEWVPQLAILMDAKVPKSEYEFIRKLESALFVDGKLPDEE